MPLSPKLPRHQFLSLTLPPPPFFFPLLIRRRARHTTRCYRANPTHYPPPPPAPACPSTIEQSPPFFIYSVPRRLKLFLRTQRAAGRARGCCSKPVQAASRWARRTASNGLVACRRPAVSSLIAFRPLRPRPPTAVCAQRRAGLIGGLHSSGAV